MWWQAGFPEEGGLDLEFANFCGINAPTKSGFKLPVGLRLTQKILKYLAISSHCPLDHCPLQRPSTAKPQDLAGCLSEPNTPASLPLFAKCLYMHWVTWAWDKPFSHSSSLFFRMVEYGSWSVLKVVPTLTGGIDIEWLGQSEHQTQSSEDHDPGPRDLLFPDNGNRETWPHCPPWWPERPQSGHPAVLVASWEATLLLTSLGHMPAS